MPQQSVYDEIIEEEIQIQENIVVSKKIEKLKVMKQHLREFTKLIIKVQSNTRKFLAIKLLKSLKYEKKVTIVQRLIRKYIRCKKKKLEKQMVIIQAQLRKYIVKKRIKKLFLVRSVIIIQSLFRRYF